VHQLSDKNAALELTSPISGIVVTPKVRDLLGTYFAAGSELLEVADMSRLRARIYISEYDLSKVKPGAQARVQVQGLLRKWDAQAVYVAVRSVEMDARLSGESALKGTNPPHYYLVDLLLNNPPPVLRPGMTGIARVYGERRSLAGLAAESIVNFWGRKVW
jgi:hypothetical protein